MRRLKEIISFLLLVYAKSQRHVDLPEKPEKCERSSTFMYRQCCVFPPFFTRDVAKSCGVMIAVNFFDKEHNVTAYTRTALSNGCDHWRCILKRYGFLTQDDSLDDDKYFHHLNRWADLNPAFKEVLSNSQTHCKNLYRVFMPLTVCEFFKFHICIRNFVSVDCPVLIPSKNCLEKKKFYEECREYFI